MSNFDFENSPDGDWDDRGELAWNEFDWQHYLKRTKQDIDRFISLYEKHRQSPDRLDNLAHEMGWDNDEWAMTDPGLDDGVGFGFDPADKDPGYDLDSEKEDLDPYTLHRHPVYIVTRGLYFYLQRNWELAMAQRPSEFSPTVVWRYANALKRGEFNAILAIQALDMGDYALAVCHLKTALSALNQSLSILQQVASGGRAPLEELYMESKIRIFDLREIWLRIMRDCREEIQRRFKEGN